MLAPTSLHPLHTQGSIQENGSFPFLAFLFDLLYPTTRKGPDGTTKGTTLSCDLPLSPALSHCADINFNDAVDTAVLTV
jgi:hypothetical protein